MQLRRITRQVTGLRHGPITRLISPGELGEELKPFIFLDYFSSEITPGFGFPMHPHSGIATLTWQPGSDVRYEDTTGKNGILKAGGLEWMNAGGGAWHRGELLGSGRAIGFQLWVPMPPGVEDGEPFGQYVPPDEVPNLSLPGGSLKVLLGHHESDGTAVSSPIRSHQDMNYFVLSLDEAATWRYDPPAGHDIAWVFVFQGEASVNATAAGTGLLMLDGEGAIEIGALAGPAQILLGTATRHAHDLVLGPSSVHTNRRSLEAALGRIRTQQPCR